MSQDSTVSHTRPPRRAVAILAIQCLGLLAVWSFPYGWYIRSDPHQQQIWLTEKSKVPGWAFKSVPVSNVAEKLLVADRLVNGEFKDANGTVMRVFLAKRYSENVNEIGLFVHTPDRCWTEAGWQIESSVPECVELDLHGRKLLFERRIFSQKNQRELVYFGGLVAGQTIPYRLDHNLSVGLRNQLHNNLDQTGSSLRATDARFWQRIWDAFRSRRQLLGPKQFIRLSTPIHAREVQTADRQLAQFASNWLAEVNYADELRAWSASKAGPSPKP